MEGTVVDTLPNTMFRVELENAMPVPRRASLLPRLLPIANKNVFVAETHRQGLHALYLGYWIKNCKKMNYKTEYRPIDLLMNQRWSTLY